MKTKFKLKLIEAMSLEQALEIFGITSVPGEDELKTLYRNLSRVNHPDRGGSTVAMQNVNSAYDLLKRNVGASRGDRESFAVRKEREIEKNRKLFVIMEAYFKRTFDFDKLQTYIKSFFPDELTVVLKDNNNESYLKSTYYGVSYKAIVALANEDKSVYFTIIYWITINNRAGGLSYDGINEDDLLFNVNITTSVLYNKRNVKLANRSWSSNANSRTLADFSTLFPKSKILSALKRSSSKLFRKADMLLGLQRRINTHVQDSKTMFIYPFGDKVKFYINLQRYTMMKQAGYMFGSIWGISPITQKYTSYKIKKVSYSILETEESLDKMVDAITKVTKDITSHHIDIVEHYTQVCESYENALAREFPKNH